MFTEFIMTLSILFFSSISFLIGIFLGMWIQYERQD